MSLVVLFGAGASYGAGGVYPSPPPLGTGLYRELALMFPRTWGAFPSSLEDQFDADFEEGMGSLWNSGSHAIPVLMQQMGMFFARYHLSQQRGDAYSRLLDRLRLSPEADSARFSSLNYDCLFEIAASLAGRKVNYFGDAPQSESDILIWKLHGSCNFLPEGGVAATRGVSYGRGVTFGTGIRAVNPGEVTTYCTGNTALYPVMAVYARGKPVQIAPTIIEGIQAAWRAAVLSASSVLVIGARPHPPDEHIWSPLSATKARLLFIGDWEAFSQWRSRHRGDRDSIYIGDRFDSCIEPIAENLPGP